MKQFPLTFALIIFVSQAQAAECEFDHKTMGVYGKNCPKDVANIVERINACRHFESEPYDLNEEWGKERKEFLDKNIQELRCKALEAEQKMIKKKYKNNPEILSFLKTQL
ncbi:MAG: hypothetical protein ACOYK8_03745 [Alphaproteobacteria bacterium]